MRTFLGVVAVLGLVASAWAQTPKPTGVGADSQLTERFNRADANRDGSIDDAEARAAGLWFQDDFSGVDTDRSGTVTLFELGQVLQQRVSSWMSEFDAADLNHNGQVTQDEAKRAPTLPRPPRSMASIGSGCGTPCGPMTNHQFVGWPWHQRDDGL